MILQQSVPASAYFHVPFCVSKCHYCDFNSYVGLESLFSDYVQAVAIEIERTASQSRLGSGIAGRKVPLSTIYFGGGTPTLLAPHLLGLILEALEASFSIEKGAEITIEANPESVDRAKLKDLKTIGFNRLSLGVQSFDDAILSRLGRSHKVRDAIAAFHYARLAGFEQINVDLMFALPGQTVEHLVSDLDELLSMRPEHVSLYELTVEPGTALSRMQEVGSLSLADEDEKLIMYETAIYKLVSAGYEHYEVSNFALPGFQCRHNLVYWRNEPFYGFGAGATSYVAGVRSHRLSDPKEYIECVLAGRDPVDRSEKLSGRSLLGETLMLGLRMLNGVNVGQVRLRTGLDPLIEFNKEIDELIRRGLLEITDNRLRVTHSGLLFLNDVCETFVEPVSSDDSSISPSTMP